MEGRVVGFIQVVDFADRLYLRQLHLIEGFRRRGIGSALIGVELKRGVETGRPVTLEVMHGNPAKRLYLRLGFAVTGQDPDKEQMIWRAPGKAEPIQWNLFCVARLRLGASPVFWNCNRRFSAGRLPR